MGNGKERTAVAINDRDALRGIAEICKEFKIKHFKCDHFEFSFDERAFIESAPDGKIEDEVGKFRKVATDLEKEFEQTLYYSVT